VFTVREYKEVLLSVTNLHYFPISKTNLGNESYYEGFKDLNPVGQSPAQETESHVYDQGIPCSLWKANFRCPVHNTPQLT
jgi:hypothetical protein